MKRQTFFLGLLSLVTACVSAPNSENVLRSHGYSETYVTGYHDGCESGQQAGGDLFAQRSRDNAAYEAGSDYTTGWDFGFVDCEETEKRNRRSHRGRSSERPRLGWH